MRLHEDGESLPAAGRERNADATRASLVKAAKRRFTVVGFERTTVRDVASDAGVNVSLISRYFGSKDGLLAAVLAATAEDLEGGDTAEGAAHPNMLVNSLLDGLRPDAWPEFGHEHPLLLFIREATNDESTAELRRRTLRSVVARMASDIDRSGSRGEPQVRATVLLGLVTGVIALHSAMPGASFDEASVDALKAVLHEAATAISGITD
ncbi:TetR family transcriptional regulator [Rhodococcus sp. G-MC3]|uniref:TetR/AcrR family transcriptional regulator n=1 Tax=Rhodococcus sp. G-MC3 TaxID=3046209 RepID=UPI0024BAD638|nr:TetR/AcrR family transcriptional regulator [Rhodococcus sp. G-MC3]MDJ0392912.1 TetR family transcriptional regulator [Rhodococcus sp. G-MC3]